MAWRTTNQEAATLDTPARKQALKLRGAAVVEAYPVDPDSPSYQYMGQVASFEAWGFEEEGMVGSRRHVMGKRLSPKRT